MGTLRCTTTPQLWDTPPHARPIDLSLHPQESQERLVHPHGRVHQGLQGITCTSPIDVRSPSDEEDLFSPSGVARPCRRQVPNHLDGIFCRAGLGDLLDFSQYNLKVLLARHLTELDDKDCGADEGNGLESDDADLSIRMIAPRSLVTA